MRRLAALTSIVIPVFSLAFLIAIAPHAVPASQAADPPAAVVEPGITYRVVNVADDDTLNIRAQPGTGAPAVATLAHDETGVEITGTHQPVGPAMWWEIIHPGIERDRGWVNSRFLAAEAVEPQAGFPLMCTGTEPFWALEIAGGQAEFGLMGEAPVSLTASTWMDAAGLQPGYRFALRLNRENPPATGWATILRPNDYCTDHMSDRLYPYDMIVVTPDEDIYSGCCSRAP